jgi:ATP adenylyltransferase
VAVRHFSPDNAIEFRIGDGLYKLPGSSKVMFRKECDVTVYSDLFHFIDKKMRMQHIYQPVMLMRLLSNDGEASKREIADELLSRDEAQHQYYQMVVRNQPGKVLTKHGFLSKDKKVYRLNNFHSLTSLQVEKLRALCEDKLTEYLEKNTDPWSHRRKSRRAVPGTVKYEVLKRAKYRCELCGISAEHKALEVDHITPKEWGGLDDISNYQALCYSCNSTKGDRDDADFRGVRKSYKYRESDCVFCSIRHRIVVENELALAIRDKYPVAPDHTLVIPQRHVSDWFDLHQCERNAIDELLRICRDQIKSKDNSVSGFNVGINAGEDAGQTIWHAHIHLIPRRKGDVVNPKGGIRGCIPARQSY